MARIRVTAKQLGDRHFQVNLSNRIALITQTLKRKGKNGRMARVKAGYFGFNSHAEAIAFANGVRGKFPKARLEVRSAKRLNTAIEVKVSHDCVEQLAWEILKKSPTTGDRINAHLTKHRAQLECQWNDQAIANAPLKGREKPDLARCGDRLVSIS
jgi:hypothetical protein